MFFSTHLIATSTLQSSHLVSQQCLLENHLPRKGFHAGAVPFHVAGIGGPGAPHEFTFNRRSDEALQGHAIDNSSWGWAEHPGDVILRTAGQHDRISSECHRFIYQVLVGQEMEQT